MVVPDAFRNSGLWPSQRVGRNKSLAARGAGGSPAPLSREREGIIVVQQVQPHGIARRFGGKALFICGLAALALSLAACGKKQESSGPKSMEEVKQEAAKLDRPSPGQYKQTMEIKKIDVPGMPPEAAGQMKAMMEKSQVREFCLTREDSEKGFRDMFKDMGKRDGQCTWARFDVSGGQIDAQMECQSTEGGKGVIKLAGTVSETGSDVTMDMDMSGARQPMGNMKMTMHMTTQRLGDCKS